MKKSFLMLAVLLAFPIAASGKECGYIGSWLGYDSSGELYWLSQSQGMSSSHGTTLIEVPGFDFSFGGLFDVANYTGNLKGTWVRTGGRTYSTKGHAIATDSSGAAVYAMQLACDISLENDCDVLEVLGCEMTFYVPDPATDPIPIWNRDPDLGPFYFPPHNGYRIKVD
jgi:hypothetical protein